MKYYQNRLQAILDDNGRTQADLSRSSGVNLGTINQICRGSNTRPTPSTITKLVNGLNLLTGKSPNERYTKDYVFIQVYDVKSGIESVLSLVDDLTDVGSTLSQKEEKNVDRKDSLEEETKDDTKNIDP